MRFFCIIILISGVNLISLAQETDIESIIWFYQNQNPDVQFDTEDLAQLLNDLKKHPIDINNASKEELSRIPFLTLNEIIAIKNHIEKFGYIYLVEELYMIEGISKEKIKFLEQLIHINSTQTVKSDFSITTRSAYDAKYNDFKTRIDVDYHRKNYSINLKIEKDANEQFFVKGKDKLIYPEYFGGNIQLNKSKTTIILGDFKPGFGQGTRFNNAFFSSLGSFPIHNQIRVQRDIRSYGGFDEFHFLRGIAISSEIRSGLTLTGFLSYKSVDARIVNDTIVTLYKSGIHRSETERLNRNTAKLLNGGIILRRSLGEKGYISFISDFNKWSNIFNASNSINTPFISQIHFGIAHQFTYKNKTIFGEISYLPFQQSFSLNQGLLIAINKSWDYLMQLRYTTPYYFSIFGSGIGARTNPAGEKGVYQALTFRKNKRLSAILYFDIHKLKIISRFLPLPGLNEELGTKILLKKSPFSSLQLITAYESQHRPDKSRDKKNRYRIRELNFKSALKGRMKINENLRWDIQFQYRKSTNLESSYSYGYSQRVFFKKNRLSATLGTSLGISKNNQGVYFYENGFYNSFPYVNLGTGKTSRHFLTFRYKLQNFIFGGKLSSYKNFERSPLDKSQKFREFELLISYQTK
ncbi:helix-hairpin-helix domain-containing protein [Mangrovivirga cuniculi]|uniref:Helix-hairpin-helix motif-containing protein n=1 Tax=Mangrovivirga cuniculi TaxID=2715131 RepID=A0A4D7JJA3_9BACT|nr:helix-hairpin-helix domain-containing protein [Mangrovivirga cuniculi]QCK14777.1 hypothetical protein DCC35_08500 [Mangrovivirga cuniculi]